MAQEQKDSHSPPYSLIKVWHKDYRINTQHTPTNTGYEGEISLSYAVTAERTTDPRVLVRTTSRSLSFAAPKPQAFIG